MTDATINAREAVLSYITGYEEHQESKGSSSRKECVSSSKGTFPEPRHHKLILT